MQEMIIALLLNPAIEMSANQIRQQDYDLYRDMYKGEVIDRYFIKVACVVINNWIVVVSF